MASETAPAPGDPDGEAWRSVFALLARSESCGPTLAEPWRGPESVTDLQSRVWLLASSLGLAPLGSRTHLGRLVQAWHQAAVSNEAITQAEMRQIARECLQEVEVTGRSPSQRTAAALALGGSGPAAAEHHSPPSAAAQQIVDRAVAEWLDEISTSERWSTLPLLGGVDALPLDEVHVELLVQPVSQSDELAADFTRQDRRDRSQPFSLGLSLRQVLARAGRQVLIIGEPGAGKSTTVKWIVRAIATQRLTEFDAAIAVSLGAYAEALSQGSCSLVGYFLRSYLPPDFAASPADLEAAAHLVAEASRTRNRVLLLLDGWDEVSPAARDHVREKIQAANKSFVTLITSRPSGVPQRFIAQSHGTAFRFSGLSSRGAQKLAARIFTQSGRPELAAEFQELLRHESDLETFTRNPFLNTLICLLFAQTPRAALLEFVRTPAQLYDRITDWIAAQYNSRAQTQELLGAKHWRVLEALSQDLLVTSSRPRYVFRLLQVESLAAEAGVSAAPMTAARFLQHIGTIGDEHSFLHATLQEYFAARGLDEEFDGEGYRDVVRRMLPARDYAEVLKFAAGRERHQHDFWKCVREWGAEPDRFQQIFCQQARLVAASGATDGGQAALGRDVRRELWAAIADPRQHPNVLEQCVWEYIALDASDLVRQTVAQLETIPDLSLQFVLLNVPRAVAVKHQLYAEVDRRRADFHGWTNPRAATAAEISQRREVLSADDNSPEQIRDLCWELGNFRDERSAPRILQLLRSDAELPEDTFENMVFALAAIGTREALDGLIDLLFAEDSQDDRLWRIQRELREPHVLDPEGRDRLLRKVAELPGEDPRVAIGLGALQGLPLPHGTGLLQAVISDPFADPAVRLAAAQCLESDRTGEVFRWIAQHVEGERDAEIQNALLEAAGNCDVADLEPGSGGWLLSRAAQGTPPERVSALTALTALVRGNDLPWLRQELQQILHRLLPEVVGDPEHPLAGVVWSAADLFSPESSSLLLRGMSVRPPLVTPRDILQQRHLVTAVSGAAAHAVPLLQQLLDYILEATSGETLEQKFSHDDPDSLETQRAMLAQDVARVLADLDPGRLLAYPNSCRPVQIALQTWAETQGHVVYANYVLNSQGSVIAGTRTVRKERRIDDEKLLVGLSGGGMRATFFHLGIFVWLAENNRLGDVTGIVSVSGGSILAGHLAKHWGQAAESQEGFREVAAGLVRFARTNLRDRVLKRWVWSRLWFLWWKQSLSLSAFLRRGYEEHFGQTTLGDLEAGKRPRVAIVATDAIRQERVVFMANEVIRIPLSPDAPATASIKSKGTDLALAVAASTCFPSVFSRMRLDHDDLNLPYRDFQETLSLNDGGVAGNLGIEVLLALRQRGWSKDELVLIGDAERPQTRKPKDSLGTDLNAQGAALSQGSRDILKERLGERWRIIPLSENIRNGSGLPFKAETKLFGYRTDLDCPTWQELQALLLHGALAAAQACGDGPSADTVTALRSSISNILASAGAPPDLPLPTAEVLADCSRGSIRRILVHSIIVATLIACLLGLVGFGAWRLWRMVPPRPILVPPVASGEYQDPPLPATAVSHQAVSAREVALLPEVD